MGQASSTIDFATALRDPTAIFSEPNDIVAHPQLSREMKLALLRQWEQTARSLSVAESEGMGGGEENKLGRVSRSDAPWMPLWHLTVTEGQPHPPSLAASCFGEDQLNPVAALP